MLRFVNPVLSTVFAGGAFLLGEIGMADSDLVSQVLRDSGFAGMICVGAFVLLQRQADRHGKLFQQLHDDYFADRKRADEAMTMLIGNVTRLVEQSTTAQTRAADLLTQLIGRIDRLCDGERPAHHE